ncbi:U11/U12 small nuclear ribonucleoprotein 25 kDa protein-like isoform X2 [Mytilus californianus]|uniref:U11/U12 small nuclear ribonucleoprotein 25 kDa protein-like isoform X2 n=1 Tax=Mytilus californianus TaxID=6549 RepID=UPI002246C44E|nr:U11/U12 small nuclear ribonucleoprotein 25 kDa protein-like isoform X2 [Mytilus californianus]
MAAPMDQLDLLDRCFVKVVKSLSADQSTPKSSDTDVHTQNVNKDCIHSDDLDNRLVDQIKDKVECKEGQGDEEENCNEDLVLSHQEVMIKVQSTLSDIITADPLLYDLPPQVTLEEINSYIALEYGQAMIVNVRRADDEVLPIVVTQNATVLDLKHAIKRYVNLKQERANGKLHLSCSTNSYENYTMILNWRYIWKRFWLYFDGEKLTDDKKLLKEYGIRNKEEVTFVKRLKEKGKHRR